MVVIGAGLGGLVAAARLSMAGKRVLLLEKHNIPGGCATVFQRGKNRFEVGLHALNGFLPKDPRLDMWQSLGLNSAIKLIPLPMQYRVCWRDIDLRIPHGMENCIEVLSCQFPQEHKNILRYFLNLKSLILPMLDSEANFKDLIQFSRISAGEFLDQHFLDKQLKLILLANLGYFHHDPYTLSLLWFAFGQISYMEGGSYYIHGGSQALSDFLAQKVENCGTVLYRATAKEILMEDNKITGVRFFHQGESVTVKTCGVIAGISPILVAGMLPETCVKILGENKEIGPSLTSLYCNHTEGLIKLGWQDYNTIFLNENIPGMDAFIHKKLVSHSELGLKSLGYSLIDYSQIDHGLGKNNPFTICHLDQIQDWPEYKSKDYKEQKVSHANSMLEKLEPWIKDLKPSHQELATPHTIQRYTENPEGAVYGYAQTMNQSMFLRFNQRCSIPNLWFASAWSRPGGGFFGAMYSGWQVAGKCLGNRM